MRHHVALVRTVLRVAVEFGELDQLPELPKLPKRGRKLPDAPPAEEVAILLENARGWIATMIAIAVYAGLRMGEIRALEVRDVDFKRGRLYVRRAISGDEVLSPKSGHERVVPIAPQLRYVVEEAMRRKLPNARVVLNSRGHTLGRQAVLTKLYALQDRCDIPQRSFHSLRHFFCSTLVRNGASAEAVRVLAGHHDLTVTQRYMHANAADLDAAIGKLVGNWREMGGPPSS